MTRNCCIPNCKYNHKIRHLFPNPTKNIERFKMWIQALNVTELTEMDPVLVFTGKRVCNIHFEEKYKSSTSKRLHLNAIPTLNLLPESVESGCFSLELEPSTLKSEIVDDDLSIEEHPLGIVKEDHNYFTCDQERDSGVDGFVEANDVTNFAFIHSEFLKVKQQSLQARPVSQLKVVNACSIGDDNNVVTLPESWSVTQTTRDKGTEITICHLTVFYAGNTRQLVSKRYFVIESWSRRMQYFVYGRRIDHADLPEILDDVSALPAILAKLHRMRLCVGLGPVNVRFLKGEEFEDCARSWHHKECSLITKKKKCEKCKLLRKLVWQRENRYRKEKGDDALAENVRGSEQRLETRRRGKNRMKLSLEVCGGLESKRFKPRILKEICSSTTTIKDASES